MTARSEILRLLEVGIPREIADALFYLLLISIVMAFLTYVYLLNEGVAQHSAALVKVADQDSYLLFFVPWLIFGAYLAVSSPALMTTAMIISMALIAAGALLYSLPQNLQLSLGGGCAITTITIINQSASTITCTTTKLGDLASNMAIGGYYTLIAAVEGIFWQLMFRKDGNAEKAAP